MLNIFKWVKNKLFMFKNQRIEKRIIRYNCIGNNAMMDKPKAPCANNKTGDTPMPERTMKTGYFVKLEDVERGKPIKFSVMIPWYKRLKREYSRIL